MGGLSPIHWLIVIVIVLLVFGPGRLAGVGKGLGEGIRAFKKGLSEDEIEDAKKAEEAKQNAAAKPADEKPPAKPADEKPA